MIQAIYDPATGRILRRVNSSAPAAVEGEAMLEVERGVIFSDLTHYVDLSGEEPALAERPVAPSASLSAGEVIANGEDEIVLSGVPAGAAVSIGLASIIADGDDIVITTDLPGENRVEVDAFPAQIWTETFLGTAA